MLHYNKMHFLIAVAVMLTAMPMQAATPDTARMEEVVEAYAKTGAFMGSVLVAENGRIVFDKSYGQASVELQVPNKVDTKYRIGSMTKQFTAAAILLQHERGKLNVNDPVAKYVTIPKAWDKITIAQLLTHTAGVPNYTALPDFFSRTRNPAKPEEIVGWVKDKPLEFAPGEKWDYSNTGYVLLGMIIEKTSGVSYNDFLAANLFTPLGMKDTGYAKNRDVVARHAYGYMPSSNGVVVADYGDMSVPFSAGALYSTTHDILTWDQALFGGKVLKPDTLKAMLTPFKNGYGYGLAIADVGGHRVVSHAGGIQGFNTKGAYLPEDKIAVVVLGNLNGMAPDMITDNLVKVALGQPVTLSAERVAVVIDPKMFDVLVGTYQLAPTFSIVFSREGDHYFAQATGQPKFEIFPLNPREYFAKVADAVVTFEVDASGKATGIVLKQNGNAIPGKKVD